MRILHALQTLSICAVFIALAAAPPLPAPPVTAPLQHTLSNKTPQEVIATLSATGWKTGPISTNPPTTWVSLLYWPTNGAPGKLIYRDEEGKSNEILFGGTNYAIGNTSSVGVTLPAPYIRSNTIHTPGVPPAGYAEPPMPPLVKHQIVVTSVVALVQGEHRATNNVSMRTGMELGPTIWFKAPELSLVRAKDGHHFLELGLCPDGSVAWRLGAKVGP